ncbi:MAG: formate dehydrogenase subunit alpha [Deltaproteobacteria bacterium]|nr:formate dehydrogenase subunit alpha [Deltaproteobacteria bacterium]
MNPEFIKTICPYCGTGCGLIIKVENGVAVATYPDREHPVSRGSLCIKGWSAHEFINHPDRLTSPLLRKGDTFQEIPWDEAIPMAASKLRETAAKYGGDSIGGLSSAKCTNEENYLFQKLIRMAFKTNNVDHCARLCHAPTTVAMVQALGSGAMTNSISDLAGAGCIFAIGSNTAESHPIIMGEIYKAADKGATIIAVDPRETAVTRNAKIHLRINPGTDIPLLCGMMRHIIDEGLHNEDFIRERMEGFENLNEFLQLWPVKRAAEECGIDEEIIRNVAEIYAKAKESAIIYCMGITQHACGTANVLTICDLAMLCGHVGTEHSGIYPLRGQNNVQGACDMGALPNVYPGYQSVSDSAIQDKFQNAWGSTLSDKPGLTVTEIIGLAGKNIRAAYIMAENPALSDPDTNHVLESLKAFDFLIVQDIFLTETAKFAHLIFPSSCFAEKSGTYTNTERRFQLLRKAADPPGNAKEDFEILCLLGKALDLDFSYKNSSEVMDEIASLAPAYGGICFDRLERKGLQWPCPDSEHPGTQYLHKDRFTRGKGLFVIPEHTPPKELPDESYPYYLGTGRMFSHYHTGTMTRRSSFLNREVEEAYAEINPEDAAHLNVKDGEKIKITTRRGSIITTARITKRVSKGYIFAPFHFTEARANMLTNPVLDPGSKIPEFKVCAADVRKESQDG